MNIALARSGGGTNINVEKVIWRISAAGHPYITYFYRTLYDYKHNNNNMMCLLCQ